MSINVVAAPDVLPCSKSCAGVFASFLPLSVRELCVMFRLFAKHCSLSQFANYATRIACREHAFRNISRHDAACTDDRS
jgi:hypothetical protein